MSWVESAMNTPGAGWDAFCQATANARSTQPVSANRTERLARVGGGGGIVGATPAGGMVGEWGTLRTITRSFLVGDVFYYPTM